MKTAQCRTLLVGRGAVVVAEEKAYPDQRPQHLLQVGDADLRVVVQLANREARTAIVLQQHRHLHTHAHTTPRCVADSAPGTPCTATAPPPTYTHTQHHGASQTPPPAPLVLQQHRHLHIHAHTTPRCVADSAPGTPLHLHLPITVPTRIRAILPISHHEQYRITKQYCIMKQYCTTSNIAPQTSIAARAYCTMKQYRTNIA